MRDLNFVSASWKMRWRILLIEILSDGESELESFNLSNPSSERGMGLAKKSLGSIPIDTGVGDRLTASEFA